MWDSQGAVATYSQVRVYRLIGEATFEERVLLRARQARACRPARPSLSHCFAFPLPPSLTASLSHGLPLPLLPFLTASRLAEAAARRARRGARRREGKQTVR